MPYRLKMELAWGFEKVYARAYAFANNLFKYAHARTAKPLQALSINP